MRKLYMIGDLHFYHSNIIKYCNRPFKSVEEMNKTLISNWNNIVKKDDEVIVVGDFALTNKNNIIDIGQKLNGKKTLVLGNHEGASLNTYYEAGFEIISKHPIFIKGCIVSHEPLINSLYPNIHAHTHNTKENDSFHFCVSVEKINYTPIDFEQIKKYFDLK